ncbi:MAG: sulfotransferase [Geminicoccaceae bacterium]|nr:sulfotransferase [Geminicoccaceae bacterium]
MARGPVQRWLSRHGHRVFHPLTGADLGTLLRLCLMGPRLTPRGASRLGFALFTAVGRLPFDLLERLGTELVAPPLEALPPPLLVVGHWRSGTTHLYNVLARSPAFGIVSPLAVGLPWNVLGLGPFLRRRLEECLPVDRIIDRLPVHADSPQEDELALANMQTLSFYHGAFFPTRIEREFGRGLFFAGASEAERRRWRRSVALFMRKLHRLNGGRPLLVKNPAHSAKLPDLLRLFPDARIVHVRRNPYVVVESTRRMLRTLLDTFALERTDGVELDRLILNTYPRMIAATEAAMAALPANRRHDLAFEDFEADPMAELARLHVALDLPGFDDAEDHFRVYLDAVRGYEKRRHSFPQERLRLTEKALAPWIDAWGYARPSGT